jgi:hypothetical protein
VKIYESLGLPSFDDEAYVEKIRAEAQRLGSDGCSGPTLPVYVDVCREHDVHYRTHQTLYGVNLEQWQADRVLRERIQSRSSFKDWSPMAWWRWSALRLCGKAAWEAKDRGTPIADHPWLYLRRWGGEAP